MTPANENRIDNAQIEWWLGMADIATVGIAHAATATERIHIEIADETFTILDHVPVVRNVSNVVRATHHGISRICYRSVSVGSRLLNRLIVAV